jgi:3-oxoacyl-[acyl-carrier protein] reductase
LIISGAAKGIGRACAEVFLATGWQVAALDRDAERLGTLAAEKKNVIPIVTDVTDPASVEATGWVGPWDRTLSGCFHSSR